MFYIIQFDLFNTLIKLFKTILKDIVDGIINLEEGQVY